MADCSLSASHFFFSFFVSSHHPLFVSLCLSLSLSVSLCLLVSLLVFQSLIHFLFLSSFLQSNNSVPETQTRMRFSPGAA